MNFTRAKPGGWALFEILTSGQMNLIDQQLEFALDAAQGGTYSPANPVLWRGQWFVDTTVAPPVGVEAAMRVVADPGRVAFSATAGTGTRAIRAFGGDSNAASAAGEGIVITAGLNTLNNPAAVGGAGITSNGGAGATGGVGGAFNGGAASFANTGPGGIGAVGVGGSGNGTSAGGSALVGFGGAAPGSGDAGFGVVAVGGTGTGGSTDGTGGDFIGGGADGMGLIAIGAGGPIPARADRAGAVIQGGSGNAPGLIVNASGNSLAIAANASGSAAAIQGVSTGAGAGVLAVGTGSGYAAHLVADQTSPVRSQLHMAPQDSLPSAANSGDVAFSAASSPTGEGMFLYRTTPVPTWQSVVTGLSTQASSAQAGGRVVGGVLSTLSAVNLTVTIIGSFTMRFTFGLSPYSSADDYHPMVTFGGSLGDQIARVTAIASTHFDVKVYDIGAAADIDFTAGATNLELHAVVHGVI